MKKNKKILFFVGGIFTIAVLIILLCQLIQRNPDQKINEDVVYIKNYHVSSSAENQKSFANGSIFVEENRGLIKRIQIVAWVEIDASDWGGIAFYIPDNWHISKVNSSFPGEKGQSMLDDYVTIWNTVDTHSKWHKMIEVGRSRNYKPTGGGAGTVVIDIYPDTKIKSLHEMQIGVEIGSKEENGKKIMGTNYIEVPLSLDDRE